MIDRRDCIYPDCQIKTDFGDTVCEHSCPYEKHGPDRLLQQRFFQVRRVRSETAEFADSSSDINR
jgi:hypothetical protein